MRDASGLFNQRENNPCPGFEGSEVLPDQDEVHPFERNGGVEEVASVLGVDTGRKESGTGYSS